VITVLALGNLAFWLYAQNAVTAAAQEAAVVASREDGSAQAGQQTAQALLQASLGPGARLEVGDLTPGRDPVQVRWPGCRRCCGRQLGLPRYARARHRRTRALLGQPGGRSMFDVLISGGQVIDGSGNVGFPAAVGIQGETVSIVRGDVSKVEAVRVIDATSRIVCPGFIDFHAHSGLVILAEPRHEPKVRQGVTTEVVGVDGNSYAPFHNHDDLDQFIKLNIKLRERVA